MDKNKKITSVLLILGLIFTVMGGTSSYYNWQTTEEQKTLVSFTVSNNFSCSADCGGNCYDQKLLTATDLVAKANASTLTYAAATDSQKGEMWTFTHAATEQVEATTDYRYIGNKYCSYKSGQYGFLINSDGTCPTRYNYVRTKISDSTTTNYTNQ